MATRTDIHNANASVVSHQTQDVRSVSNRTYNAAMPNNTTNSNLMHPAPTSYPGNIVPPSLMQPNILSQAFILPPNSNSTCNCNLAMTQALPTQHHKSQAPTHYQKVPMLSPTVNTNSTGGAYPMNPLLQKFHQQSNQAIMHHKTVIQQQDAAILNAVPMAQATVPLAPTPLTLPLPNVAPANPVIYAANGQVMQVAPLQMAMHPVQTQDVPAQTRALLPLPPPPPPHQIPPPPPPSQQPVVMEEETVN